MKKIVYTVCSANHLAHCKTMADSFIAQHPEYSLYIVLVDRVDGRFDLNSFKPYNIIEISELSIPDFVEFTQRYTVIELNCAVKSFAAQYLFREFAPDMLLYIDSDTFIYNNLSIVESYLIQNNIVITPHYTSPLPNDHLLPRERDILRSGLYNAGFIGFSNSAETHRFLAWWSGHMQTECHYNFEEGMGVDQNWLNWVPLFFEGVYLANDPGLNVAYWNLHERKLTEKDGRYWINDEYPLLFLHISGYDFAKPEQLSRHQNRHMLSTLPVLQLLLHHYTEIVKANGWDFYRALPCAYAKPVQKSMGIMKTINQLLAPLNIKINKIK
ncbi:hypothetical protein [Sediminibacterium sp. TEGAF015]|uniref:hypothetical protein n=1 Tax=Sediminibacterium sp. TEGAF015 TaxID=575378 RepID=UPI00220C660A|nr:hypothetical protein [Sediminibacterium sp. TEGAF015]BDQ11537.1 hypothetical protein TEGAF0_07540 [Sediminibacterium sp. TEGAF015]